MKAVQIIESDLGSNDVGDQSPTVEHGEPVANVSKRHVEVDAILTDLGDTSPTGDFESTLILEANLLDRVLEPRRNDAGPDTSEKGRLSRASRALRGSDRRKFRSR